MMKKIILLFFHSYNFFSLLFDIVNGNFIFPLIIEEISDTNADVVADGPAPSP